MTMNIALFVIGTLFSALGFLIVFLLQRIFKSLDALSKEYQSLASQVAVEAALNQQRRESVESRYQGNSGSVDSRERVEGCDSSSGKG